MRGLIQYLSDLNYPIIDRLYLSPLKRGIGYSHHYKLIAQLFLNWHIATLAPFFSKIGTK